MDMNVFMHSQPITVSRNVQYKSKLLAWLGGRKEVGGWVANRYNTVAGFVFRVRDLYLGLGIPN